MEPESVRILKWVYLIVFLVGGSLAIVINFYSGSAFDSISYTKLFPETASSNFLLVFQWLIGFYLFLMLVDAASLFNYRSLVWREISAVASLVGFLFTGVGTLLLIYLLGSGSLVTTGNGIVALLYLVIAVSLLLLDLLTFFVDEEELLGLSVKKKR